MFRPQCTVVDFASEIDTLEDQICEMFDVSEATAAKIAAWHRETVEAEGQHKDGMELNHIAAELILKGNVRLKVIGLVFAAGLNRINGWSTERAAARDTGFTVAAINAAKNRWIALLNLPINEHCKSRAAREKYREINTNNHWRRRTFNKPVQC